MRRYASWKFRLLLLGALLLAAGVLVGSAHAQAAPPEPAADVAAPSRLWDYLDYLFYAVIAFLSVSGLTLIIQGFIKNRASVFMPETTTERIRQLIAQGRMQELVDVTQRDPSFVSQAVYAAVKRAPAMEDMKEAMQTAVDVQTAEQFRRIEYLNIIGNLGPLLGLLGTVLGMIKAFTSMHLAQGSANPAQLAGGISSALTHTFLGLFVAVPCLAAFGTLRTMVDRLTIRGAVQAEELLLLMKSAGIEPPAAAARPPVAEARSPQPSISVVPPPPASVSRRPA